MTPSAVIIPTMIIAALGAFFAIVLAIVAKKLAVARDERIESVSSALPGLNCGGCSFPSCMAYAETVIGTAKTPLNLCKPGGEKAAAHIATLVGRVAPQTERYVALRLCRGGRVRAADEFIYQGTATCRAAALVRGGAKACKQGCLGFGDCVRACMYHAITMDDEGLPVIDRDACIACGACVNTCPKKIVSLVPIRARVFVECRTADRGIITTKQCQTGCIGCKKCEKVCAANAIHVTNNCAAVDYARCTQCGKCVSECPRHCITHVPARATSHGIAQ